jgi:hypothetical protein
MIDGDRIFCRHDRRTFSPIPLESDVFLLSPRTASWDAQYGACENPSARRD